MAVSSEVTPGWPTLTEHQMALLRDLDNAGGILIVRREAEFAHFAHLEELGYVTSQSTDFGDIRFRLTPNGRARLHKPN